MAKSKRRKKRSPRFSIDAEAVLSCRASKKAEAQIRSEAKAQQIPVSIHLRRIIYRHLGFIEGAHHG